MTQLAGKASCTAEQIEWPRADFLCTAVLARRAYRLPSYRLPFVAAECDVQLTGRHRVLINARGAALVAVAMARQHRAGTPGELAEALGTVPAVSVVAPGEGDVPAGLQASRAGSAPSRAR